MARLACRGKQLRDELREQRARLLARAAPLEADVGAFFSPAVDAVAPAAARPWLRDLDERGHARLAVFEAQELREGRRCLCLLGLEDLEQFGLALGVECCVSVTAKSPSKSGLRDVLTRLTVITDGTDAT